MQSNFVGTFKKALSGVTCARNNNKNNKNKQTKKQRMQPLWKKGATQVVVVVEPSAASGSSITSPGPLDFGANLGGLGEKRPNLKRRTSAECQRK